VLLFVYNLSYPQSFLVRFLAANCSDDASAQSQPETMYPQTRRDDVREVLHEAEVLDPFRWLEDQNSPETRAWLAAQNKYTESLLSRLPGRDGIRQRLTALMKVDAISVPIERNGWYFYSKRRADQDLPVIYTRKGIGATEEVLIDPHPMSPTHMIN